MVCTSEGDDPNDANHTPLRTMGITKHSIGNISDWYGAMALLRTIASAGFIPFSYEGITYDAKIRRTDNLREQNIETGWLKPVPEGDKQYLNRQELVAIDANIVETEFRMDTGKYTHTKHASNSKGKYTLTEKMKLINFDMFKGGSANDTVYGSDEDNVIWGGEGQNYMNGQRGNDTIYFGRGTDIAVGGEGNDQAIASYGNPTNNAVELIETSGHDVFNGIYLRDAGRYVVVENRNGGQSYIHESIESIRSSVNNSASTSFQSLWEAVRFEVRDPDQEATREHFLMGADRSEDFYGGAGRDTITGAGGKDKFHLDVFDRSVDYDGNMDRILDLDRNDRIVIHSSILGINPEDAVFRIVSNDQERRAAMSDENVHFAYDTRTGDIFWDANGANRGGGRGLAKLVGNSDFMDWELSSGEVQQIEFI